MAFSIVMPQQGVQTVHEPWEEYVGEMCDGITRKLYGTLLHATVIFIV
jgi:hypothetical protein